ncbi:hypothetical protein T439DRAFT_324255 [Meredithblackwellia eburnea MCA 4105]
MAKPALTTETTSFRLHISGLAPTTSKKDLIARFSSFGLVPGGEDAVGGLGVDANGTPRTFAFVTLETTQAKLGKCTSMLNGSMWKGHKLKIGLAKPDWHAARAAEREKQALEDASGVRKSSKRKRRKLMSKDPNLGEHAKHWEIVTAQNIERHKGWSLDANPTPIPVFPLVSRPLHPLPPLPEKPKATSWTRETPKQKAAREKRELKAKERKEEMGPLTRARRVRIDGRKWGRKRIVFNSTDKGEGEKLLTGQMKGSWECVESSDEEGEFDGDQEEEEREKKRKTKGKGKEKEVKWVLKAPDGSIRRTEIITLGRKDAYTDQFKASLEALASSASTSAQPTQEQSIVIDPCPSTSLPPATYALSFEPPSLDSTSKANRPRTPSPPPYISAAPRTLLYNEEDDFALKESLMDEMERGEERKKETGLLVEFAKGVLGTETSELDEGEVEEDTSFTDPEQGEKKPQVEGFADDDDEDEFMELMKAKGSDVLRLRGGAKEESSDEESQDEDEDEEDSSENDSSDEGKDNEMEVDAPAKTTLAMGSLKDMFKPQEGAASFSLFSGLEEELDLEPIERTPTPPPVTQAPLFPIYQRPTAASFSQHASTQGPSKTWTSTTTSAGGSFFTFPTGAFETPEGEINWEEVDRCGIDRDVADKSFRESRERLEKLAEGFWFVESDEQANEDHTKARETLRGHARKRHREATKRSGGGAGGRGGAAAKRKLQEAESGGAISSSSLVGIRELVGDIKV